MTTLDLERDQQKGDISANWPAIAALVLTVLGWIFTAFMTYGQGASSLRERIGAVEQRETDQDRRVNELHTDLRSVNEKLDRLLERAR